jgi:CRP-like cAMP-binding protein
LESPLAWSFLLRYFDIGCYCATHRAMTLRHVSVDEVIIREGERGDEMYIIERYSMQLAHLHAW